VGTEVNPDRAVRQENNRIAFEDLIKRVVNNSVLAPAGIRLEPGSLNGSLIIANTITANQLAANTITADEIAAGTITATQLSSNIILVNNIIRSNNYNGTIAANGAITANGNTGWAITSFGSAEFSNAVIRGNVTANAGSIGGWTINSNSITAGSTTLFSTGAATFGNTAIAANGRITNGGYTLSNTGVLTATGANISGAITATTINATVSGRIGPFDLTDTSLRSTSYNSQNYMEILDYGDILIYSSPLDGGHASMRHRTDLVGEYIQVSRLAGYGTNAPAINRYITLGSTNGAPGNIGIGIVEDNVSKFKVYQDGNIQAVNINLTGVLTSSSLHGYGFTSGRHNTANLMVHTDGNGYLQVGYINSSNGNEGNNSNPSRVWGTNGSDDYLRSYLTSALSVGSAGYATSAGSATTATSATTAVSVTGSDITGHVFNSTTGIRFPGPLNTSYSNMPSDFNFSLNFQYSNTGGLMYALVNGDNGAVRNWATSGPSDRRLKENINSNVSSHLEKFYALTAYEFEFNEKMPIVGGKYIPTGEKEIGLIAQEVKEIFPNMVFGQEEQDSYLQINYQQFCKLLIAASLDQNKRINELEARIQTLEGV
jgi:hypothetical protein